MKTSTELNRFLIDTCKFKPNQFRVLNNIKIGYYKRIVVFLAENSELYEIDMGVQFYKDIDYKVLEQKLGKYFIPKPVSVLNPTPIKEEIITI